ncbi:hypothetical protein N7493_000408 [Penicillium malachiteum]|uniref:Xylanolytic transcriptional activator regulatory domain-containing protein n=1 Tax=Penicillium malachiteum TaxID=1324776 RepID=A0AAD6HW96_9EURO|nr:hypothetical protein N7493_000408 [Penicillium malachiteum]
MFNTFIGINLDDVAKDPSECRRSQKPAVKPAAKEDYESIFKVLFPSTDVHSLRGLSRANLLERAKAEFDNTPTTSNDSSSVTSPALTVPPVSLPDSEASTQLQNLRSQESTIFEWDETPPWSDLPGEDQMNIPSQFLFGIPSIEMAIQALAKILPIEFREKSASSPSPFSSTFEAPLPTSPPSVNRTTSYREEQRLINAYFSTIHVFAPIIHEPSFRNKYLISHDSQDRCWLALLNMVLALGSIASSSGDSTKDLGYYHTAQQNLSVESFGSGRLEILQSLILMGGQYLHFRNRPHMASAIIATCYRVAGDISSSIDRPENLSGTLDIREEVRRRNWMTIYVLDTWTSVTLGRPSTVDVSTPSLQNMLENLHTEIPPEPTIHSPLLHNIDLCRIINQIQERILNSSLLELQEIHLYDNMLLSWFENLPQFLQMPEPTLPDLQDARLILKWRYQNIRLLLYRPILLNTLEKQTPFDQMAIDEQIAVSKCREIAAETVLSIQTEWRPTKICCWHASGLLFQACLVPIMALTMESRESSDYGNWYTQVQIGIAISDAMSQLDPVNGRTKESLERLFQAVISTSCSSEPFQDSTQMVLSFESILSRDWHYLSEQADFSEENMDISYLDDQLLFPSYPSTYSS